MKESAAPIDVVRRWFAAFERDDMVTARTLLRDDAVLHATHPPELAGTRRGGLDMFLEWYGRKRALAGDGFAYRVVDLLAGDRHAAAVLELRTERARWLQTAVYRVDDGRIVELWLFEDPPVD